MAQLADLPLGLARIREGVDGTDIVFEKRNGNPVAKINTTNDNGETGKESNYLALYPATTQTATVKIKAEGSSPNISIDLVPKGTGTVTHGGSASGDVVGPASATDNRLVRWDGITGKLVQNSSVTLDDSANMSGLLNASMRNLTATNSLSDSNYNRFYKHNGTNPWIALTAGSMTGDHVVMGNFTSMGGAAIAAHNNTLTGWATLYIGSNSTNSNLVLAGIDVSCTSAAGFKTDIIAERTAATGVTVDGVLLKDSGAKLGSTKVDSTLDSGVDLHIQKSGATRADASARLFIQADSSNNVAEEGVAEIVCATDGNAVQYRMSMMNGVLTDYPTGTAGSLVFQSAGADAFVAGRNYQFFTGGTATGYTTNSPGTITGSVKRFQIDDSGVKADTIGEVTSAAGVTVDGVLLKDSGISFDSGTNTLSNYVATDAWTPTLTATVNLDANPTASAAQYERIGGVIFWRMQVSADPTTGSGDTQFTFTLPVNLSGARTQRIGNIIDNSGAVTTAVFTNASASVATAKFGASGTGAETIYLSGSYLIN